MKSTIKFRLFVISLLLFFGYCPISDASDNLEETDLSSEAANTEKETAAPSVEELISEALENSPVIHAARSRLSASRELISPASALPDPEVMFSLEDNIRSLSSPGFTKGEIAFKQAFPFPGKRDAKGKTAGAESEMAFAGLVDIERQITKDVRTRYASLYALDCEAAALDIAKELINMLEATAAMRYSAGEGEQEAQIKAQLEASRLLERMSDIAAERAGIVAGLNRLLGRLAVHPVGKVTALPPVFLKHEDSEKLEALALANSPAVLIQKYAVKAAQYRLESAKLDLRPDFFAGVGMGFDNNDDPMALASFGLTIPAWQKTKQKPLQRAAGFQLETSKNDLSAAETDAVMEIAGLIARWRRDQEQIGRYRDAIIPQTSEALSSARASYMVGRSDFSSVVEDYNLWLDARTQLARRESDRFITWAEVDALIAPFPSPQ